MHIRFGHIIIKAETSELLNHYISTYYIGFESGKTWPEEWNHLPGGPVTYICELHTKKLTNKPDWLKCICKNSKENWRSYMLGFHEGVKQNANLKSNHPALKYPL